MVTVDSAVGNKKTGESNKDAKVGLEIQPNSATTALVSHWLTTATGTLVPVSLIPVSVYRLLASVCSGRPPLSQVQLPSHVPRAKSIALSVKLFKDIQDVSMYEGFLMADDSDDN